MFTCQWDLYDSDSGLMLEIYITGNTYMNLYCVRHKRTKVVWMKIVVGKHVYRIRHQSQNIVGINLFHYWDGLHNNVNMYVLAQKYKRTHFNNQFNEVTIIAYSYY